MKIPAVLISGLVFFYVFSGNGHCEVVKYNKAKAFDGYNFYTDKKASAYLMDMAGHVVHRWSFPEQGACWEYARLLNGGDIVVADAARYFEKFDKDSKLIWRVPIAANHDIEVLPDGSFLVPAYELPMKFNNRAVTFDSIVHISKDGRKLDTWSTYEHRQEFPSPSFDFYANYLLNTVQVLPETGLGLKNKDFQKGNWLICFRQADMLVILDKDTHKIVWSWGPGELTRPCTAKMLSNGNILIYDNSMGKTYNRTVIVDPVSRKIVEEHKLDSPVPLDFRKNYPIGSMQVLPATDLGLRNKNFQKGNWLFCFREENLMVILDKDTHKTVWSWGPGELEGPHMPRMLSNGHILFYDSRHMTSIRRAIVDPVSRKIIVERKVNSHPPSLLSYYHDLDFYIKWGIYPNAYYHLNSIQLLPETKLGLENKDFQKGNWLICFRDMDLMLILDKDTHQVVWSWGLGELDRPHMPRMLSDGNILVFDNGMHRTFTRLVIVSPVSRRIVWEYRADPKESFHSVAEGSGQLLPNGNFLICETMSRRAFEITPNGEIVWEFLNPEKNDGEHGTIYRMSRIPKEEVSGWLKAGYSEN